MDSISCACLSIGIFIFYCFTSVDDVITNVYSLLTAYSSIVGVDNVNFLVSLMFNLQGKIPTYPFTGSDSFTNQRSYMFWYNHVLDSLYYNMIHVFA